jgi:hypothetical protein
MDVTKIGAKEFSLIKSDDFREEDEPINEELIEKKDALVLFQLDESDLGINVAMGCISEITIQERWKELRTFYYKEELTRLLLYGRRGGNDNGYKESDED